MKKEFAREYYCLGQRIKYFRNIRKLTQEQLAGECGIDFKHLSKIENGNDAPSMDLFFALARALHVEAASLMDFRDIKDND